MYIFREIQCMGTSRSIQPTRLYPFALCQKSSKSGLGHVKLSTNYLTIQLDSTVFY